MKCYEWRTLEHLESIINRAGRYAVNIREYCRRQGIFHFVNGENVITLDDLQEIAYLFDVRRNVYAL